MTDSKRAVRGNGSVFRDTENPKRWVALASAGINPATGRRQRIKRYGSTPSEAAQRLRQAIKEAENAAKQTGPRTVAALLEAWVAAGAPSRRGRKSDHGIERARYLLRAVVPVLGRYKTTELRPEHIEAMLNARSDLSRDTLNKMRGVVAQAYDWAIARQSATWNPARVAVLPQSTPEPRESRALTAKEADRLLRAAAGDRLGAWVVVSLTLALRPGEVSGLHWEDLDLERGLVVVHRAVAWVNGRPVIKTTKTKRTRTIELPPRTVAALRDHRRRQTEERLYAGASWPAEWDGLVFRSQAGTPLQPTGLRRLMDRLAAEAGIEGRVNPYDLRHTATTRLSEQGVAPELLADLLGHRDTRMVFKHYRHPVTPTISVAAKHIEDALRVERAR